MAINVSPEKVRAGMAIIESVMNRSLFAPVEQIYSINKRCGDGVTIIADVAKLCRAYEAYYNDEVLVRANQLHKNLMEYEDVQKAMLKESAGSVAVGEDLGTIEDSGFADIAKAL